MSVAIVERFQLTPLPNGALKVTLHLGCGAHVDFVTMHDAGIELTADLLVHFDGHLPELKDRFAAKQKLPSETAHGHPGEPDRPNPAPDAPLPWPPPSYEQPPMTR